MSTHVTPPFKRIPIFIGGSDRSGTTLLGAFLGARQDAVTTPESQFKIPLLGCRDYDRHHLLRMTRSIIEHARARAWLLSPDVLSLSRVATAGDLLHALVHAHAVALNKTDARYWVDHTPSNLRYASNLRELFPEAKFIHLVRDGRAVAASVLKLPWGPEHIVHAAHWWTANLAPGLLAEATLPTTDIMRVRYEDLCTTPTTVARDLCAFLEWPQEDRMLQADGFRRPGARHHRLVGTPPVTDRIDAWQGELSEREVELFEYLTGDVLTMLDYPSQNLRPLRPPTNRELRTSRLLAFLPRPLSRLLRARLAP